MTDKIRIATRESTLALWQANYVKDGLLAAFPELQVEIIGMTTEGDRNKVSPLSEIGGKGVFVKELESALFNNEVDIAVHSMKDVPSELPDGLSISAICERADPRDAFVSTKYKQLEDVPSGGRIGSSSLRRRLQLKAMYPHLEYIELRGNVGTRLRKLDEGDFEGIILASAGLNRLGLGERISEHISPAHCIPSAGQGAVGIESRNDDSSINELLQAINHNPTELCVRSERMVTLSLGATCNLPIAAFAELKGDELHLSSFVSNESGSQVLNVNRSGPKSEANRIAGEVADALLSQGAAELIHSSANT
jgi:hydroxymethylbilane synthase